MKKIRYSVFETNSSSQHSLIYKHDGRSPSELEKDGDILIIHVGDFTPKNHHELWTQKEKLGYLFTYAILRENLEYTSEEGIVQALKLNHDLWNFLIECLLEYTNCSDIKIVKDESVAMDNLGEANFAEDVFEYGLWMKEEFLDFVFDDSEGMDVSYD